MGHRGRWKNSGKRGAGEGALGGLGGLGGPTGPISRRRASVVTGLVFTGCLVVLLGLGDPPLPYRRGQVAKADIRARVSFSVVDETATKARRDAASAASASVYRVDMSSLSRGLANFKEALAAVRAGSDYASVEALRATALGVSERFFGEIKEAQRTHTDEEIAQAVSKAVQEIVARGSITQSDAKLEGTRSSANAIVILDGEKRYTRGLSELVRPEELGTELRVSIRESLGSSTLAEVTAANLSSYLKPFLSYDEPFSMAERKTAADGALPVEQFFARGDALVRRDSLIDNPQIRVLQKEQQVYLATMPTRDRILRLTGLTITMMLAVWLFGAYTSRYQPRVLARRARMIVLMAMAVILAGTARLFVRSSVSWYLMPLPLFAMAVAIAYNHLFAIGYTLFLSIVVGVATGSDFALSTSLFLGCATGIWALGRVTSRTRPFLAGVAAGGGILVAAWGTGLLFHTDYELIRNDSFKGLVNGGLCGALITVLLPFVERSFNVITDLSLLEMADLNKPLLRRLALEAPGTYNHSLFVGNLADSAAEVIGANQLFARVGGYYHDIGKLAKPDYFVENHGTTSSRHYNLSPTMSALVIISHVKDGVELAKEYKLAPPLLGIVREHHGSTLVEYFYREAREKAEDEREVSEGSFRYPGPKPQTKESAIVMLADSVESASRTIEEPTAARLESLVTDIVRRKLADGQFDECPMTMGELKKVEISLTKSLAGIFHSRIKYPGREL